MADFDKFKAALRELCQEHGFILFSNGYCPTYVIACVAEDGMPPLKVLLDDPPEWLD